MPPYHELPLSAMSSPNTPRSCDNSGSCYIGPSEQVVTAVAEPHYANHYDYISPDDQYPAKHPRLPSSPFSDNCYDSYNLPREETADHHACLWSTPCDDDGGGGGQSGLVGRRPHATPPPIAHPPGRDAYPHVPP
jgi:hypothetical protein